jgi:hypothetical protein
MRKLPRKYLSKKQEISVPDDTEIHQLFHVKKFHSQIFLKHFTEIRILKKYLKNARLFLIYNKYDIDEEKDIKQPDGKNDGDDSILF